MFCVALRRLWTMFTDLPCLEPNSVTLGCFKLIPRCSSTVFWWYMWQKLVYLYMICTSEIKKANTYSFCGAATLHCSMINNCVHRRINYWCPLSQNNLQCITNSTVEVPVTIINSLPRKKWTVPEDGVVWFINQIFRFSKLDANNTHMIVSNKVYTYIFKHIKRNKWINRLFRIN